MIRKIAAIISIGVFALCSNAGADAPVKPSDNASDALHLGDLDRKANPCNDFYEFGNGTWRAENPVPPSMQRWGRRVAAHDANWEREQKVLEDISLKKDSTKGSSEQLLGDFYASCMAEPSIDAAGLTPLAPMLAEIDRIKTTDDVQRMIRRLQDISISVPFQAQGNMNYHQPADFIENITAGGLGLPDRDYYVKTDPHFADAKAQYVQHVANILALSGMPPAKASSAADEIFSLEKRLAEASVDSATAADPAATDHMMTFAQLKELTPHFDWEKYFDEAKLSRVNVNVAEPKFMQQMDAMLQDTSVATWQSYLKWHLLDSASPTLSRPFVEESFNFTDKYLAKAASMKSRTQRCVAFTETLLGEPLGKKYAERYFPPAAKAKAQEIARNLLAALKEDISANTWMQPNTKKIALIRLTNQDVQVGYPDKWKDYSAVVIRRDSFWANVVAARRFNVADDRMRVGKLTGEFWRLPPSSADAYIDFQLDQMVLPAGALQPPFFDPAANDAVNYGSFGVTIAHDLSHQIDPLGAENDVQGRPIKWWAETDQQEYQKRGQCVSAQFDGYFVAPGVHHDGKRVLGESVADLIGMRVAYQALQQSMKQHPVPTMDGFTPDQQFFIAWEHVFGQAMTPEAQQKWVAVDPHPTPQFRVKGVLVNTPEFQQTFACNVGSEMVKPAEQRCAVW